MNEDFEKEERECWEREVMRIDTYRTVGQIKEALAKEDYKRAYELSKELCELTRCLVYDGEY